MYYAGQGSVIQTRLEFVDAKPVCFYHRTYSVGQISSDVPTERKVRESGALNYSEIDSGCSEQRANCWTALLCGYGLLSTFRYHSRHVRQSSQPTSYFAHGHSSKERRRCSEVGCDGGFSRPQSLLSCLIRALQHHGLVLKFYM